MVIPTVSAAMASLIFGIALSTSRYGIGSETTLLTNDNDDSDQTGQRIWHRSKRANETAATTGLPIGDCETGQEIVCLPVFATLREEIIDNHACANDNCNIGQIVLNSTGVLKTVCTALDAYKNCIVQIEEQPPNVCRIRQSGLDLFARAMDSFLCDDGFQANITVSATCISRLESDYDIGFCGRELSSLFRKEFGHVVQGNQSTLCSFYREIVGFLECPSLKKAIRDKNISHCGWWNVRNVNVGTAVLGAMAFASSQLRWYANASNCSLEALSVEDGPSPNAIVWLLPMLATTGPILFVLIVTLVILCLRCVLRWRRQTVKYKCDEIMRNARRTSFTGDDGGRIAYTGLRERVPVGRRISFKRLSRWRYLNEGSYGFQYKAKLARDGEPKGPPLVAVKVLKLGARVSHLFREGDTMANFGHPHVLRLVGISFVGWVPLIVTPLMPNGDLLTYIRKSRSSIKLRQLLVFARQIADGMVYLHSREFVHRDLACRNCLLDLNLQVKIGDFGLARTIREQGAYRAKNMRSVHPLWTSPEGNRDGIFTTMSDVWSYGVVLWELMTRGRQPYENVQTDTQHQRRGTVREQQNSASRLLGDIELDVLTTTNTATRGAASSSIGAAASSRDYQPLVLTNNDDNWTSFMRSVESGHRLSKPEHCPAALYAIMGKCWKLKAEDRPTFSELRQQIVNDVLDNCVDRMPDIVGGGADVVGDSRFFLNISFPLTGSLIH